MEVGRISFTFELSCTSDCQFVFMEVSEEGGRKDGRKEGRKEGLKEGKDERVRK